MNEQKSIEIICRDKLQPHPPHERVVPVVTMEIVLVLRYFVLPSPEKCLRSTKHPKNPSETATIIIEIHLRDSNYAAEERKKLNLFKSIAEKPQRGCRDFWDCAMALNVLIFFPLAYTNYQRIRRNARRQTKYAFDIFAAQWISRAATGADERISHYIASLSIY